jgi:hypothetical protein
MRKGRKERVLLQLRRRGGRRYVWTCALNCSGHSLWGESKLRLNFSQSSQSTNVVQSWQQSQIV